MENLWLIICAQTCKMQIYRGVNLFNKLNRFIHSCILHLLKFNSHWPSLRLKSGLCPGAPRWMPWRTSNTGVLFASGFAAVSQIVSITRRWLWTLTSVCQRPLCIHIALAPQRKGHSQAPLCEGLIFITKKSHFSSILMRGSWGQSRLLAPFEWDIHAFFHQQSEAPRQDGIFGILILHYLQNTKQASQMPLMSGTSECAIEKPLSGPYFEDGIYLSVVFWLFKIFLWETSFGVKIALLKPLDGREMSKNISTLI